MLLSTTGVRVSQHWCGSQLVNSSIWGDAEPCDHFMASDKPACPMHKNVPKKKCCDQREFTVEPQEDDFAGSQVSISEPFVTFTALGTLFEASLEAPMLIQRHFRNHSPPPLNQAIYLITQSFRI